MTIKPTLSMSQKAMLVMTPKLQQAIKILQMPRLELAQYLSQQMLENPVLEEDIELLDEETNIEGEDTNSVEDVEGNLSEADFDMDTGLPDSDEGANNDLPIIDVTDKDFGDIDWKQYFEDSSSVGEEWEEPLEEDVQFNTPIVRESLQEHLLRQLRMSVDSEQDYNIGEFIIGNIDDDGYLTISVEEIASELKCGVEEVNRILSIIQEFEPAGVGARNLRECLLIQLRQLGLSDSVAYKIVERDLLKELEANHYPMVSKILGVSMEELKEAMKVISRLEPKPGRQFGHSEVEYIVPDLIVDKIDGKYVVRMDDQGPRLRLSQYYLDLLNNPDKLSDSERNYIKSKIESASWLLETIERRRNTILKVAEAIFDVQKDALDKGFEYLKPLTLKDIADRVGVHEATVSRVVRNRYVQTPRGIFELRRFFSTGISKEDGEASSAVSVKELIKNLVDAEDPSNPLSDKEIQQLLAQKGLKIARRTVAKYRAELGVPPSNKRKQW